MTQPNTVTQFWSYIDKTDKCWMWKNGKDKFGYGVIVWRNKKKRTHRLIWELTNGQIPSGMCVCHHCDNPSCVNPDHLFLGTKSENTRDMINKGRNYHKVSKEDVREIRKLYSNEDISQSELARKFNINQSEISRIVNNVFFGGI